MEIEFIISDIRKKRQELNFKLVCRIKILQELKKCNDDIRKLQGDLKNLADLPAKQYKNYGVLK